VGPVGPGPRGLAGRIRHAAIAETPSHGVAVSDDAHHGWLVRWDGARFVRETRPPSYEDEYFEGDKLRAGGYGNYMAQADWRLEKAARQIREMRARTALARGRVLDVGSGYGFFRVALGAAGYEHDGLEVSQFARAMASSAYGLRTHEGTLAEHCAGWESRYDAVTLFDLIEHVDDPGRLLEQVAHVLRPGGVLGIKTPNIDCPEAQVFGPHYHSLKREHLSYFSAASLTAAARGAGFEAIDVASVSHLLVGFVGRAQTRAWERELHGADLVAWYRLGAAGGPPLDHSRVAV
jgi:2-polyprenyl-3-methyl-5-hydroxy-6-metoxy-1,4-benzoquinol methylase